MRRDYSAAVLLGLSLHAISATAGMYAEPVQVLKFETQNETDYELVVSPTRREAIYFEQCKTVRVIGKYSLGTHEGRVKNRQSFPAWVTRESHIEALGLIREAQKNLKLLNLGWVGAGLRAIGEKRNCTYQSKGLAARVVEGGNATASP